MQFAFETHPVRNRLPCAACLAMQRTAPPDQRRDAQRDPERKSGEPEQKERHGRIQLQISCTENQPIAVKIREGMVTGGIYATYIFMDADGAEDGRSMH